MPGDHGLQREANSELAALKALKTRPSLPLFDSKCCMASENFEVRILVQDNNIISDGDRGDQAIDKLSDGLSIGTTLAVKDCCLVVVDWSCVKN